MEERESKNEEAPATENDEGNLAEEASGGTKEESLIVSGKSEQIIDEAGSRTFTMRELLNELKNEEAGAGKEAIAENSSCGEEVQRASTAASDGSRRDGGSSFSQESFPQHSIMENDISMDLINKVSGTDDEGRSRQKILVFSAKRYADAIEKNPNDHDAYYNWALVLQESADIVAPDSTNPTKDSLLEEACKKYEQATQLCPTLHDAFYNWAIAISDRAKIRGRTLEAEELWKQATKNYEKAVQLNWNSPQALNNWGLALQELSAIVPIREKQNIVRMAISKFRASIRLQFDFHRAIYNLGTVLYGLAEDTVRAGRLVNQKEISPKELYSQSAIYIAAAYALKPNYSVYRSALRLVHSKIPLPYLKVGHLTAPPARNPVAPHADWERYQFVLNHEGLQQVGKNEQESAQTSYGRIQGSGQSVKPIIKVEIPDILSVSACADLTLPPGAGLCIETVQGPVYLAAETWESLDGWLDAIRLVYTIYARGRSDVLAGIIAD
ncbi:uncharacterized protein LOC110029476 [Phalaenopsis equestris]|uniref:uncharacterized protein LOC110029476 n=1 Tax=Phalaenopsis equestris TaxID=78828 RepID=UPI0009E52334|nr:uncharacterized protein LOC110029476 [Phalaenopsis equestris]